jgi:hypothetical protein
MTSPVSERDRWFESGFLQRRVHKLSVLFAPHAHLSAARTAGRPALPDYCPLAAVGLITPYPGLIAVQQIGQPLVQK